LFSKFDSLRFTTLRLRKRVDEFYLHTQHICLFIIGINEILLAQLADFKHRYQHTLNFKPSVTGMMVRSIEYNSSAMQYTLYRLTPKNKPLSRIVIKSY